MGSPQCPSSEQYAKMTPASQLAMLDKQAAVTVENGEATLSFELPRQGVSLLVLEKWEVIGAMEREH